MTVVWTASSVGPDVRADALRATVRDRVVPVELDLPVDPDDVRASLALSDLGDVQVCTVEAMPTTVTRTHTLARTDERPALFVTLQVAGTSMTVQHGRHAVLRPGELVVYTTTSPYTLVFPDGVDAHFFRVPLDTLALPPRVVDDVSGRRLDATDPLVAITATYLQGVAGDPRLRSLTTGGALARPTVELLRAALAHSAGAPSEQQHAEEALATRILEHVRTRLADPDLDASSVAAAHHVSVRHLYNVLRRAGVALGPWVRTSRLEGARHDLSRATSARATVAGVARRWGFRDASAFSRAFRAEYGMSPREWRALSHTRTRADVAPPRAHPARTTGDR